MKKYEETPVEHVLLFLKSKNNFKSWLILVLQILIGSAVFFISAAFFSSLFTIKLKKVEPSLLFVDRHYNFIASLKNSDDLFGFWPLPDTINKKMVVCTKAAEDHRFNKHLGIDFYSIGRAVRNNYFSDGKFSGASTIAMQVARLQGAQHKRNIFYKIRESFTAIFITVFYGREKVLRHYLTIAPYGNRIAGINYASRRYFNKPLQDLTWAENAFLIALPNAPGRMNPYRIKGFKRARKRAQWIISRAKNLGWIDETTYKQAIVEIENLSLPQKEYRPVNTLHAVEAAEKVLKRKGVYDNLDPLNPTVRLALDLDIQDNIHEIAMKEMMDLRIGAAENISIIVLKRKTGEIISYLGSEDYFDNINSGAIDFAATERSTGSLLKPFIYALGMEWNGFTPATLLTDIGLYFGSGDRPFLPRNYDEKFLGPVLYQSALANSRNMPAIQVLGDIGIDLVYQKLAELGITKDDGNASYYGLGLAVGNMYSSLTNLCQSYLSLANEGEKVEISWEYQKEKSAGVQLLDREVALQIQRILSDPQCRLPSFPRGGNLEYRYPVAVKTGTSSGFRDAWTIGWSEEYLVGLWIGRADNEPMNRLSGYKSAAPIVQTIFSNLHPEKQGIMESALFSAPKGYKPVQINNLTGDLADSTSPYSSTIFFKDGTEPIVTSKVQKWIAIDKRNGLLASPDCGEEWTELKKMFVLPSIFKDWATIQGIVLAPTDYSPLCSGIKIIDDYKVSILNPRQASRLYIDPEMPKDHNLLILNCSVKPRAKSILWIVDGQEYKVVKYPYKISWPLQRGKHTFRAEIPWSSASSNEISIEVF